MLPFTLLSFLLLISAVQPAPRSPAVVEVNGYGKYPARDSWPLITQDNVFEEEEDQDIPLSGEDGSRLPDHDEEEVLLRDLEHRFLDSLNRVKQQLLLIHLILDQSRNPFLQRPYFVPGHEYVPESDSGDDDYTVGDPLGVEDDDDTFSFPFFDQPTLFVPRFPVWHDFPSVDNLPDDYDNSTYEVHVVNGTRIEVNKTTNKESGDNFNSFFHREVIHISPDQEDAEDLVTTEFEPETTTLQLDEEVGGEPTEMPVEDDELPSFPEVENEVASDVTTSRTLQNDILTSGEDSSN